MDMQQMKAMEDEYAKWLDLVAQLKATGAVTEEDGNSPLHATRQGNGCTPRSVNGVNRSSLCASYTRSKRARHERRARHG